MSERIIETVKFTSVMELAEFLEDRAYQTAGIQQADGRDVRAFQVIESTLSDGSKVTDIRFVPWVVPAERFIEAAKNYPGGPQEFARALNELTPEQIKTARSKGKP